MLVVKSDKQTRLMSAFGRSYMPLTACQLLLLVPPCWSTEGAEVCGGAADGMINCRDVTGAAVTIHAISCYICTDNLQD